MKLYHGTNNPDFKLKSVKNGLGYHPGAGSVDEKLQTCDFKKKQYQKLMSTVNIDVEFIYILSDWFRNPAYKDTLDYIVSVGCQYYFEYLPLQKLGLPVP